jgi:DNA helicase HerA-like ATPase
VAAAATYLPCPDAATGAADRGYNRSVIQSGLNAHMSQILIGKGDKDIYLLGKYSNRHGMIAGATGTGKSVSLMVLAEGFSKLGVPVFLADVKGDLAGLAQAGVMSDKLKARIDKLGIDWTPNANPVVFWDVYGKNGHPVRATISDMGPLLLGRLLNLNETQRGVLSLVFKVADDAGLLLLDVKDLRAMLQFAGENAKQFTTSYGNISAASIGAIQRALLEIEQQGGAQFFGEPMLDMNDLTDLRSLLTGRPTTPRSCRNTTA